ncbi:MAG TPA: hypothetical protein VMT47_07370 [Polyangia bacterium]|nr:hypothetical protein [Polyangia bacterium]
MLSRSIGIIIATWLPCLALMLPISPLHTANFIVSGLVATALAMFSMGSDRARLGVAVIGAWVAFTPFVFRSTFTELVVAVCWGVTMFATIGGPFSESHRVTRMPVVQRPSAPAEAHEELRVAA